MFHFPTDTATLPPIIWKYCQSAKSKIDTFPKLLITNALKYKQHSSKVELSNEWSHFRGLSIESKVRKLCITQGFTLGVKGLKKNWVKLKSTQHRSKVLFNSFPINGHTLRVLSIESKVRKLCITHSGSQRIK